MSDVAHALNIIDETFGPIEVTGRARVIARAITALEKLERSLSAAARRERRRQWTERRVRSIVDREAARMDAYEIEDLKRVQIEEARHELMRSRQRQADLAALLSHRDEDFHGADIEANAAMARGLDRAGNQLAGIGPGDGGFAADPRGQRPGGLARARDFGAASYDLID